MARLATETTQTEMTPEDLLRLSHAAQDYLEAQAVDLGHGQIFHRDEELFRVALYDGANLASPSEKVETALQSAQLSSAIMSLAKGGAEITAEQVMALESVVRHSLGQRGPDASGIAQDRLAQSDLLHELQKQAAALGIDPAEMERQKQFEAMEWARQEEEEEEKKRDLKQRLSMKIEKEEVKESNKHAARKMTVREAATIMQQAKEATEIINNARAVEEQANRRALAEQRASKIRTVARSPLVATQKMGSTISKITGKSVEALHFK